jgi:D-alanyl-D-alanine dipeptidase
MPLKKGKIPPVFLFCLLFCFASCTHTENQSKQASDTLSFDTLSLQKETPATDTIFQNTITNQAVTAQKNVKRLTKEALNNMPDSAFVELLALDSTFVLHMKYATDDNFLKTKVYNCDQCLLRVEVARALAKAQQVFQSKGYRIKLYDCYRPLDIQKKMWAIMPDDRYVGNPYKNGSVHNKGAAVDLTLVDAQGNELDMGTAFDHFGREAHHAYRGLSAEVLANRKLLKQVMEEAGFLPITSEWWHYFYKNNGYPVANFKPSC